MIKRLQIVLTLIITLGVTPQVALARPSIDIEGLSDESATNLDYYIESVGEPVAFNFTQSKWRSIVSEALTPLGFYNFNIAIEKKGGDKLILNIDPGSPMLIAQSDINIVGEAKSDADFIDALKVSSLDVGQQLNHKNYDDLKSRLRTLALQKGYFDSGPRYRFGEITIVHSQIDLPRLESLKPFKRGDQFETSMLADYQIQLSETGWFKSVLLFGGIT
ncbi:POTRA domain-containing protein [Vibrio breoganii]